MTDNPQPDRIPITRSVSYAARGLPEVPFLYGPGVIRPSEITLTYRAAPDSQLGRVHAYVKGRLWVDEREVPTADGYGQHYDDGLDGWPVWLAEEARLHDPDAAPAVVSPPPATLSGRIARRVAEDARAVRSDLYDDLDAFARQTGNPGLQHAQIRDQLAEFLLEGLLRRAVTVPAVGPSRVADQEQPAPLRAELKPWQLLGDQPDEPLPQTERLIGGRRLKRDEEQPATEAEVRRCAHNDIVFGLCIRPVPHDGECFHERQPARVDEETDEDSLCGSEYPGDDNFVGQLCALPKEHFGEHRCAEEFAGTSYTALLRWPNPGRP